MSEEPVAEPTIIYQETVITDHKGNKTKTTKGRKIGVSGNRYYTTTKTKTKTDADGNVRTEEIATTYEGTAGDEDGSMNAYRSSYKEPHLKEVPSWQKPAWAKTDGLFAESSLRDGRNLEKPITPATTRKTPTGFATFKLEK